MDNGMELHQVMTQSAFGELVGIGQPAVSDLMRRNVITAGDTASNWLLAYCEHMREVGAGRVAAGELDLGAERAALAREQRVRLEMQNALTRRELAPVAELELALAIIGRKVASALAPITANLNLLSKNFTVADIETITAEVAKAQQIALNAKLVDGDPDCLDSNFEQGAVIDD